MLKRFYFIILVILVIVYMFFLWLRQRNLNSNNQSQEQQNGQLNSTYTDQQLKPASPDNTSLDQSTQNNSSTSEFQPPLDRDAERVTKKFFGTFVTPQNSPVQPERFYGYHTGIDYETFAEEKEQAVAVKAICQGKLVVKKYASGYGGVAVQACVLDSQPITVIYGHLKLDSIAVETGSPLNIGQQIGILGQGFSSQTNGERKHLHLGIHKGIAINILGYVNAKSQLANWVDPCQFFCKQ